LIILTLVARDVIQWKEAFLGSGVLIKGVVLT